jgi:hypothetical protein
VQHLGHHEGLMPIQGIHGEMLVGEGIIGERTHLIGLHRIICRFHPTLLVGAWGCRGPHYQGDFLESQYRTMHRERKALMGKEDNNHQIYVAINNHQYEDQSILVGPLGKINNVKIKILFDLGALDSFISPFTLEKCGLIAYEHDEFK